MDDLLIFETEHCTVHQASGYRLPGYLIVQLKAPCTHLSKLAAEPAVNFFRCLTLAEAIVEDVVGPERIYVMKFGEMVPQVHFHVFPRTARVEQAYRVEVEDEPPLNGAGVVHWVWDHHAELGHTDMELTEFVRTARARAQEA